MARGPDLRTLRRARAVHRDELVSLPNVIGSAIGVKRRAGARVTDSSLIVFVQRKIGEEEIRPSGRVPRFVRSAGRAIPTDVVEIAGIREEFGSPPYFTSDREKKGTVTAFARSEDSYLAVTCGHCLRGRDGNPFTSEPIDFWDAAAGKYVPVGESVYAVMSPGFGRPGNFGFSDAGLVLLRDREIIRRARISPLLPIAGRPRRGTKLVGEGPRTTLHGEIDMVEAEIDDRRIDLIIHMLGQGTVPGNSGMLWRTMDGAGVALHAFGAYADEAGESRYSLCMAASRLAGALQVDLLDPGAGLSVR